MKTAYQGEIGAYSEAASRALFPDAIPLPHVSFEAVFEALVSGEVDRAVVPIENSLFGSVHANYDLLCDYQVHIEAEVQLRIRHMLLALPGVPLTDIETVYSHPQALGQCRVYLREHLPHARVLPVYDTAGAARMIREQQDLKAAAIAGKNAATQYELTVLAEGIESDTHNYTRFLALARGSADEGPEPTGAAKTSLVYTLQQDVAGSLFRSLAVFALRDLSMLKIESRPLVGSPGQYRFYIDVLGARTEPVMIRALDHLTELAPFLKILGSYPIGPVLE